MSQQLNEVRVGTSAQNTFDLKHHQVTTSDFGYLIPICCRNMYPNDDFEVTPKLFARLGPAAFPFYGRITCRVHNFFVPYRLLFPGWNSFITMSESEHRIPPYFTASTLRDLLDLDPQFGQGSSSVPRGTYGRVMANLGLNPDLLTGNAIPNDKRYNAFRFLAYYRIWLDWFMDSNIYDHSQMVAAFNDAIKNGGALSSQTAAMILRTRNACFGKDYLTTAKINPQAGSTPSSVYTDPAFYLENLDHVPSDSEIPFIAFAGYHDTQINRNNVGSVNDILGDEAGDKLGKFTVEELRAAVSLQRYLERNNYVGSKVINQLLVHFGIAPTPERLDMSEYIGGSNFPVQVGDVTSTSPSSSSSTVGLGAQAGKGIAAGQTETVRYHAREHGVFMTLLSILPDTAYYQGIPKEFTLGVNGDPLDFYTPEFENLGFQEILNSEVFVPEGNIDEYYQEYDPDGIFGYAPRYAFLKWTQDILAGDFVGNLTGSSPVMGTNMDAWHLFRKFVYNSQNPLALNANFVECDNHNNDFDRVFQITDNELDHFYFNIDVDVKATRPMVGFAEPSLDSNNTGDGRKINLPYGGTRL